MKEGEEKRREYPLNAIRICVDQRQEDLKGRVYSRLSTEAIRFENAAEFLLKTNKLFDQWDYPQSYVEKRSFFSASDRKTLFCPGDLPGERELLRQRGEKKTLDVMVKSRRQGGWQGYLLNKNLTLTAPYASELELLRLIWQSVSPSSPILKRMI